MKWVKRISIWIIISLFIQFLGLYYINNHFLVIDAPIVTKKVEKPVEPKKPEKIEINVPSNAEKINVSYDAKYLSYYQDDKLKIVNTKDGSVSDVEIEAGTTISFYKWIPGRNRMLLVEKTVEDGASNLILYYYDLAKKDKVKMKTLDWLNEKSEVQEIELSTLTGVTYIKVGYEGSKNRIYRISRENEMSQVETIPEYVNNMASLKHQDKLVYEGKVYNKIYMTSQDEAINVNNIDKVTLLGSDDKDIVYVGELQDGMIKSVYDKNILNKEQQWKCINLENPIKQEDIFTSSEGKIYINDPLKGVVTEVFSGKKVSYQGKLLQIYNKGVVSLVDGKICLNECE